MKNILYQNIYTFIIFLLNMCILIIYFFYPIITPILPLALVYENLGDNGIPGNPGIPYSYAIYTAFFFFFCTFIICIYY